MVTAKNKSTLIDKTGNKSGAELRQIFINLELVFELAKRGFKTKYRKSVLGVFWAFIQPLLYIFIIYLFFSLIAKFGSNDIPYPLYLLTGIIPMQFFVRMVSEAPTSISGNANILSRIYIPQIVFPAASFLGALFDLAIPLLILILFLIFYGIEVKSTLIYVPFIFMYFLVLSFATHLLLSALLGHFTEFKMAIPATSQVLFFGSPIFYPISLVPENILPFYYVNPMVGFLELFRWSIFGLEQLENLNYLIVSNIIGVVTVLMALILFPHLAKNTNNFLR